jgi:thiamine transport system substrate-binding protein
MPKITTITKGWSEAYGLFLDDEVDMVLSYTTSPSYHRVAEEQTQYDYLAFAEGHYTQIEVAAMLASTDQPELSREFLQFMLTPEAQSLIPTTNWMYPAVKDITLPDGFEVSDKPKGLLLDDAAVASQQNIWLEEWIVAVSQN